MAERWRIRRGGTWEPPANATRLRDLGAELSALSRARRSVLRAIDRMEELQATLNSQGRRDVLADLYRARDEIARESGHIEARLETTKEPDDGM